MWAMVAKEFRQLRRDRRTVAMMIVLPVVLLVVFIKRASRSRQVARACFA
jgi:ABC-2 type transport system permease protein